MTALLFTFVILSGEKSCHPERSAAESKDLHLLPCTLQAKRWTLPFRCHPERSAAESKDLHFAFQAHTTTLHHNNGVILTLSASEAEESRRSVGRHVRLEFSNRNRSRFSNR